MAQPWGETLSGAGTGAAIGSSIAPGIGTGIGAGLGALGGFLMGRSRQKSARDQKRAVEAAMARLAQVRQESMAARQADLRQAMGYYAPAQDVLSRLYGTQFPQGGGG